MKKIVLLAAALLLTPLLATAADLANGERINRNCALCHGAFAQGAKGRLSPRLAGLPREYLIKAMEDYRSGVRRNPTMMETTGLANMSNNDIEDIAAYLNMLDLTRDARFDVRPISMGSDLAVGETIFMDECKDCHGRDGRGKPNKEAPPLTGQHGEYIFLTIKLFQAKLRNHDNDPEDETFKAYSDQQILNTVAFISTLDDKLVVPGDMFRPPMLPPMRPRMTNVMQANAKPVAKKEGLHITDITQTVAQMSLKEGISAQDAVDAMLSKAVALNLKLVGQQYVSKELEARGVKTPYLTILQFCDPMDARTMILANPIFSSYMPCRISLVEDKNGALQLMMLNLDMLINSELMPQEVVDTAIKVNQQMLDIMVAGATGEF